MATQTSVFLSPDHRISAYQALDEPALRIDCDTTGDHLTIYLGNIGGPADRRAAILAHIDQLATALYTMARPYGGLAALGYGPDEPTDEPTDEPAQPDGDHYAYPGRGAVEA
jgi:hypothetical protein